MVKDNDRNPPRPSPQDAEHGARRPYVRPELTAYGPLAKLTRSQQSGAGEGSPQGVMRKCL